MLSIRIVVVAFILTNLVLESESLFWGRRRRRRRSCTRRSCSVSSWSRWSACSRECGTSGTKRRTRTKTKQEACGGSCPYILYQTRECNRDRCQNYRSLGAYSYGCICRRGYRGTCCEYDVNECLTRPCQHICRNTFGSYICRCYSCYTKLGTRCELRQCRINNGCYYYGTINPRNACQDCNSAAKTRWTNNNTLSCSDDVACTKNDRCSSGRCVGTPFTCLPCEECNNDRCRVKPGFCVLLHRNERNCFSHGTLRPGYPCQQCDSNNKYSWTSNNNLRCSDNNKRTKDDRCISGDCVGTPYNCLPCETHDGSGCPIKSEFCVINHGEQKTCFGENQYKPGSPCQWCKSNISTSTWLSREGVTCDDGNQCTRGDTCTSGQCTATAFKCNSLCQTCNGYNCSLKTGFGFVDNKCTCKIAGNDYKHQALNPVNQCQWCDINDPAARASSAWTNRPAVACDDQNNCTRQDMCNAGRCVGQGYSCQASYPTSSCIQTSKCVGDGTCRNIMKPSGTICRGAADVCDQPERCDGSLGTCPGPVTDAITMTTGTVQFTDQTFQFPVKYQYFTDKLFLRILGFSVTCGHMELRWFILSGGSSCSVASSNNGTFLNSNTQQTLTGLSLQDNGSYKLALQAADMRDNVPQLVCSDVITLDTSKPQGGWIHDGPGADLSSQASKALQVNWGGVQTKYGVGKYEWKVLLTSFETNQTTELMPFTSVNLDTKANKTFSNITDGSKALFVVRSYTKAGLHSDLISDGVVIDTSPPIAAKIYDGSQPGVDLKFSKWTNTFIANWDRFIDHHSPISRYQWGVLRVGRGLLTSFKNSALNRSFTATGLNLVSGEEYCAVVRSYSETGLYSQATSDCMLIDHDAPEPGTVNDGLTNDVDFQSDNTTIAANWNGFNDGNKGSGIVEYKYKVTDVNGTTIVDWTTTEKKTKVTKTGLNLSNLVKYFVAVRAIDAVGLSSDVTSDGIIVDRTHPVFNGKVIVKGIDDVINGTPCVYVPSTSSVSVKWVGFHDAHSGIQGYEWAIITVNTSLSTSDFRVVPGGSVVTTATLSSLTLTQGGSYYVIIRAYNRAKLYKDASSVLVIPDSTPPFPGKVFDGSTPGVNIQYQDDLNHVYASWTPFSEPHTSVKQYYYAVGSCITGNYHMTGNGFVAVNPANATSFLLSNITLVNGQRYCVKVKAENKAGLLSSEVSSDGFIADVTPPSIRRAQVRDGNAGLDIDYQANTSMLSAEWDGITDAESGIKFYEYGISRNRGGTPDVLGFENVGLNTSATASGLSLVYDVYYVIVCAVNNAGLRKCTSSDGVLIYVSPPSKGVVHDGIIEPDLRYQSSLTSMAANWEGIWDLESGIEKFEWSIRTSQDKNNVLNYTDVGLSTHVKSPGLLNLVSGTNYYVYLKVTNQAGAVYELLSDGVTVDGTPPLPTKIFPGFKSSDDWAYDKTENTFFSTSMKNIAVYWDSFLEPESEIWYYKWAIGTSLCGTQIQPLINIGRSNSANTTMTDLVFRSGMKYYVTVTSRNRAGLVSRSCSDALILDNTPPRPGTVVVGQPRTSISKGTFVSNVSVVISWSEFSDLESGINKCNTTVTDQGGSVIFLETHNGSAGSITVPKPVILLHRATYTATVQCTNKAGLTVATKPEFFSIDNTAPILRGPIIAGVSRDNTSQYQSDTDAITAIWEHFTELESSVESYQFAIGTKRHGDDIVKLENVGLATQITKTGLGLSHGTTYFITVIAKNLAGLYSNASSLGLLIDTTPPYAGNDSVQDGLVGEDRDYFTTGMDLAAHWENIHDSESGIIMNQYCVGTKALGCQIRSLTNIGVNNSFTCPECTIIDGERVYVTVHVRNGAGLSVTRASDGLLFDTSPPMIGEVIDGSDITGADYNVVLEEWNISMSWFGVEDVESGVQTCVWTIQSDDGLQVSQKDIGNHSSYGQRAVFTDSTMYRDLPFVSNIFYYNVLTCWNKAGAHSSSRSNGFRTASIWPVPAAVRDGSIDEVDLDFITSTKVVGANWDVFKGASYDPVIHYELAVGTAPEKDDVLRFTNIGLRRNVEIDLAPNAAELDFLIAGQRYYLTVRATSLGGLSSIRTSDGFAVDPSPPMTTEVSVTHVVQDQRRKRVEIRASWNGVKDYESGIKTTHYCLGTTPRTCVHDFLTAEASTYGTISDFMPESGAEYHVTVFVINRAGLTSVMTSSRITLDVSPPSQGEVIDGIGHDIDFASSTDSLSIQWGEFHDEESGIESCSWTLVEQSVSDNSSLFGNDSTVFTRKVADGGFLTQANLSLVPGARYVSHVTCYNGDGFSITAVSDGVVVDITPPSSGTVHDGLSMLTDIDYQSSTSLVQTVWQPFTDLESGIMGYRWALGTSPDKADVLNFTNVGMMMSASSRNVSLIVGRRYYVTVEAVNGAGLTFHGWSDGFLVDVSPPELTEVSRGSKLWLGPGEKLHASWKSHDPESDIFKTEYCVGTLPVGCQVQSMTRISQNASDVTCTDCQLNHRGKYYITVRVWNGAGLYSFATTDEINVDLTPPYVADVIPQNDVVSCDTNCTLVYHVSVYSDEESGMRSCSYAVRNGSHFITDFDNYGLDNTVEVTKLHLVTGEKYDIAVRCENNVGLLTEVVSKRKVLVDNTPPTQGSVIVSADHTHDVFGIHSSCHLYNRTLRAHWFGFHDQDSGISGFRVAVGKQPNAIDILSFQDVGVTTNITLPLNNATMLFEGDLVYVTVESRNTAGLTSHSSSPPTRLISADNEDYAREGDFYCLNV